MSRIKLIVWFLLFVTFTSSVAAQDDPPVPFDPFNPIQSTCQQAPDAYFAIGDKITILPQWLEFGVDFIEEPRNENGDYIWGVTYSNQPFLVVDGPICYVNGTRYWLLEEISTGKRGWSYDGLMINRANGSIKFFEIDTWGGNQPPTNTNSVVEILNCTSSTENYITIGDTVQLINEMQGIGMKLVKNLNQTPVTWIELPLYDQKFTVVGGPFCSEDDFTRYWIVQMIEDSSVIGWISDGAGNGAQAGGEDFRILNVLESNQTNEVDTQTNNPPQTNEYPQDYIDPDPACFTAVEPYFGVGDYIRFAPRYRDDGYQLIEDIYNTNLVTLDYAISSELLGVLNGPYCRPVDGRRYWEVQVVSQPELVGWVSDGTIENSRKFRWFELVMMGYPTNEPDGHCPAEILSLSEADYVLPAGNDVHIYPDGPWNRQAWYDWTSGLMQIYLGPVCHEYYRYWGVIDPTEEISGWVIEIYDQKPNIRLLGMTESPEAAKLGEGISINLEIAQ